jgi:aminoglycoside 6'-N-acetyltransferase I
MPSPHRFEQLGACWKCNASLRWLATDQKFLNSVILDIGIGRHDVRRSEVADSVTDTRQRAKMKSTVEIKVLSASCTHHLQHIAPDVFDDDIIPEQLDAFLEDPRHLMFLAVDDGQVIGMASAFEYLHPDKTPQLFINEVGVAPTHRRRGVGRRLVESLIACAKDRGCDYAWLGTDADNVSGNACFASVPGAGKPQPFMLYEWDLDEIGGGRSGPS